MGALINYLLFIWLLINHVNTEMRIPIGLFRAIGSDPVLNEFIDYLQEVFTLHMRAGVTSNQLNLVLGIVNGKDSDCYAIWQPACEAMRTGIYGMLASGDLSSAHFYDSLAARMHVPFINWHLPPSYLTGQSIYSEYSVSIQPPNDRLIAEWILRKNWTSITFMHDGDDAMVNLEQIYDWLAKSTSKLGAFSSAHDFVCEAQIVQLPSDTTDFESFLYDFHRIRYNTTQQQYRIIVQTSSRSRQKKLLRGLEKVSLQSPERFHYVIADYGLTDRDIDRLRMRYVNFTTFQIIDSDQKHIEEFQANYKTYLEQRRNYEKQKNKYRLDDTEYDQDEDDIDDDELPIEGALIHDALRVALHSMDQITSQVSFNASQHSHRGRMLNFGTHGLYCHPTDDPVNSDRQFVPLALGRNISERIRNINLYANQTLTGRIEFDSMGIRRNFDVKIHEITYHTQTSTSEEETIVWNERAGFKFQHLQRPNIQYNNISTEEILYITTVSTAPFVIENVDADTGEPYLSGYCIDLVELLAKIMKFKYVVRLVKDEQYGSPNEQGDWDGMVGELLRGDADMAVAPLTISRTRERVVDFSKPFITTGISIMIKKPDKQEFSVFSFMQPLSKRIWILIVLAQIGVSFVIFLVSRFSPYEWRVDEMANGTFLITNDFSIYNCLWFTLAAFMQQGTDILPRSVSGRIASSAWWFFTMIMIASYTANLAAFLTSEKLEPGVNSVNELASQHNIKYGIKRTGSTRSFFSSSRVSLYQKMWNYMSSQEPSVFVESYDKGIERVRNSKGQYAFLLEATANEYQNTRKPCNTMKVGALLNSIGYGVATPIGSPIRNRLNLAILELQERGDLKKLENKWWYDLGQCEKTSSESQSSSLNLSKVAGIFYILIGGMLLAMLACWTEYFYRIRGEQLGNTKENVDQNVQSDYLDAENDSNGYFHAELKTPEIRKRMRSDGRRDKPKVSSTTRLNTAIDAYNTTV